MYSSIDNAVIAKNQKSENDSMLRVYCLKLLKANKELTFEKVTLS